MNLIISLLSGFISAFIGITPPGLLNMTAAKVSMKDGRHHAFWFVSGAVFVIFLQVYLAVLFARIINARPDIVLLLREVGFVVFGLLTVYFLWIAKKPKLKKPKIKKNSKKKRFFLGMLLSALNFFPIPYYVFVSVSLSSYALFSFDLISILIFVSGAVLGSFLVFYFYIVFFQKIEKKADYFLRNMNVIIGSITGLVSLIALVNILQYYFL
ncbi:Threonine/homoserine/homoserine lactone efflux protein [Flavobacterium glycines]|uniref:Lysine transporter LysE n=1 Tax=Flavobacterium glycines TaxID=551990 RepID=A0A1B9DPU7_9FLAO|nr:LysE family transporter [Flavobacterium glycines]OCB71693.1 lysine transporter LysE [Flavobacterium glycines]GEL10743.1 lysine transporter LysE [Flavobacterium glycines]SDI56251.1 Threonine/homoserine/homoserine lactone efflux protein [Flavobacterium glycines]